MQRILIVTNSEDVHADAVAAQIAKLEEKPFRIDLDRFPRDYTLNLENCGGYWRGEIYDIVQNGKLRVDQVSAVWLRKRADHSFKGPPLAAQEQAFAEAETEHILHSILYALDCAWMSHPRALRGASWKGEQLQRAAAMGFKIPPSIITNNRTGIDRFIKYNHDVIFKPLSSTNLAADQVRNKERVATALPTTRIDVDMMEELDAVDVVPCFFQRYIPKQYELRVTVVGDMVFSARIHSQDDERTMVDSRDMSADIRYESINLPLKLDRACRDFVHSYDLTYGAIDLIVTPDDEYVFLENNPVGQFRYIEELVPELKITKAVAQWLRDATAVPIL